MTDDALRVFIYDRIIESGAIPTLADIGSRFGADTGVVRTRLGAMKLGKTVLVHPGTGEVWMAGPFSSSPTSYKLSDGTRTWYANCAWDMLGVAMIVNKPLLAETKCSDCGEPLSVECDPGHPPSECQAVVHFLVPARRWYDDIGFT